MRSAENLERRRRGERRRETSCSTRRILIGQREPHLDWRVMTTREEGKEENEKGEEKEEKEKGEELGGGFNESSLESS